MGNASDRRQVEAAQRREKGARRAELDAVRYLMGSPLGRSLAARLIEVTGADRQLPFTAESLVMARDVGVQGVGFWLLGEIREGCPELELLMRNEARIRAQRVTDQEDVDNEQRE